jgi:pimeloyl-ACP methyl ester carboxylesterase
MAGTLQVLFDFCRPHPYGRPAPLILLNGLAEQAESWFRNHRFWRRYFDVHTPNVLAYEGDALHRRIQDDLPISVDYLVNQLHRYVTEFVQTPPYHLVASSMGGKVAVEFAVRYPDLVARLVLICPSGLGDAENLPVVEGVRRSDFRALIDSVFWNPRRVDPDLVEYYRQRFTNRRWRSGLLRTIRGTMEHCVRPLLAQVSQPTLLISGREDRIVNPTHAAEAAGDLPNGHFVLIPHCGHAPQMEKPRLVNRLVVDFLTRPQMASRPLYRPSFLRLPALAGTKPLEA